MSMNDSNSSKHLIVILYMIKAALKYELASTVVTCAQLPLATRPCQRCGELACPPGCAQRLLSAALPLEAVARLVAPIPAASGSFENVVPAALRKSVPRTRPPPSCLSAARD